MGGCTLDFQEINDTQVALVGGKAAHLGELFALEGIRVPDGFCVTTEAYRRIVAEAPSMGDRLADVARLDPDDRVSIRTHSAGIRSAIEGFAIPDDLVSAVTGSLARLGPQGAYAVRSSATAEDLPTASFAGQQDTFLNVIGLTSILEHISRCWASLYTERAVTYRLRNGFESSNIAMAVVVQQMVFPQAAGVLFTADPVTGNRKVTYVEATLGLGEALVSGMVNPDVYEIRASDVTVKTVGSKSVAHVPVPAGGTKERRVEPSRGQLPALTDLQAVRLAQLGRRIEAHFGSPQDVEWCLADDEFHIVQSRPITTLFPVPATEDGENHVYLSVGHQQMMTDAMKPLGLSVWQLTTPRQMAEAGNRLFVDVTQQLQSAAARTPLLDVMGRSDPLMRDALETILERGDFVPPLRDPIRGAAPGAAPPPSRAMSGPDADAVPMQTDPAVVAELVHNSEASIAALRRDIEALSGPALLDFVLADFQELKRILFDPRSHEVFMSAMEATWWLNDHLEEWLGEKNAADTLTQSVPGNVTSEMGLALLDVADVIRLHPDVIAVLERVEDDQAENQQSEREDFLDELPRVAGGPEARDAITTFLDRYGMRCVGEIDITRPRWSERPATLVPLILGNVKNFDQGAGERRFEQGRREARAWEHELLTRLQDLPDGAQKADETKQKIDRVRTFIGYREYPKYFMISRYLVYKQALLREAERLVRADVLRDKEDIFYLRLPELHEVVRTNQVDEQLTSERKAAFSAARALTPPRVLTSDGEAVTGSYRRIDFPPGALAGLAVSGGTVEGRARVLHDLNESELEAGEILVTAFTDPSWTAVFATLAGLVTEVGGLMTHGAVIAREYGLPAVVGVQDATRLIRDGQRIRVNGTEGYVEIMS